MRWSLCLLALLLGGCASDGRLDLNTLAGNTCRKPDSSQELALKLAEDTLGEGKLYAGLAHLENLPDSLPQVRLDKARVLRQLDRPEAAAMYQSLLGTCLAAEGEHGLGQLAAARGDNRTALEHLRKAMRMEPTDERIRNDLGVVYLNDRMIEKARFEFLTAMELRDPDKLAAQNLVVLLLYQDQWQQAAELVSHAGITPAQFTAAQQRAEQMKQPAPASAEVGTHRETSS